MAGGSGSGPQAESTEAGPMPLGSLGPNGRQQAGKKAGAALGRWPGWVA